MKTIIVPTDFSVIAENAMRFAIDMAQHINASLLLLHIYQIPVAIGEVPMPLVNVEELQKSSEEKLKTLKNDIEKLTACKVKVYTEARLGDVVDELQNVCATVQPFAVILGTKGSGALERMLFGSVTLSAMKHLDVPVMVIPPGARYKPVHKIGLACDFKNVVAATPEKEIKSIVKEFNAELHVLNVDYHNQHFEAKTPEESFLLHNMLAEIKAEYHFIEKENVEEGINEFAETNNIDFVIVIPKKHQFLEGLFHKSHSKELAFHSHVPVMAIHE
ncbi:MAG: universal stress protein [Flavihumibacter sp.]|nr:universal stress protein [Flavihumibacter sp.]